MKFGKKVLSIVLCLVIIFGITPLNSIITSFVSIDNYLPFDIKAEATDDSFVFGDTLSFGTYPQTRIPIIRERYPL